MMNKEEVTVIAQLLTAMKDATARLEKAIEREAIEEANSTKKEILLLKEEIDKLL